MKGIVYQVLNQFVDDNLGEDAWEDVLINVAPESEGAYTAVGTYDTEEFFALLTYVCNKHSLDVKNTVFAFGEYLFPILAKKYPVFVSNSPNLKEFLKTIDDVIHVEVRKLYPDAELPSMSYEEHADGSLTLCYQSPRKLCVLAEGLATGASKHFNQKITLSQPECMHAGADKCQIKIQFLNG